MNFLTPFNFLLDCIAPPICAACKIFLDVKRYLCDACVKNIQPVVSKMITITATKKIKVYAAGAYTNPLRTLLLAKSRSDRTMSVVAANLLWEHSLVRNCSFDVIVPIPLHWTRYAWRGYNQAAVIADVIARKSGKPVIHALTRNRYTPYLSKVRFIERGVLMKNIFSLSCDPGVLRAKRILLVDDLITTGVTLATAAQVLYTASPACLNAGVVARVS